MNIYELVETKTGGFTKTDRIIYEKFKKQPDVFAEKSYTELVDVTGVSAAALTRFAKKIGFAGFNEFQFQLSSELRSMDSNPEEKTAAAVYGEYLIQTENLLDEEEMKELAENILKAEKVYLWGFNASSIPAKFMWISLKSRYHLDAHNPDYDFIFESLQDNNQIVIYSVASGEYYHSILMNLRKRNKNPKITLVTMNPKHSLRRYCDQVIVLPSAGKTKNTDTAVTENMIFMMFNSALLEEIRRAKK